MKTLHSRFRPAALLCAGALLLALAGCGSSGGTSFSATASDSAHAAEAGEMFSEEYALEDSLNLSNGVGLGEADITPTEAGSGEENSAPASSRKIIYNAWLSMESTDFDAARTALLQAVEDAGGYLESSNLGGSAERQSRWADYSARIPVANYRSFLAAAGSAASVLSQSETAQDITNSYIDVEARLTALTAQRDRLNELVSAAETTADLLEIESQLSEVQYQIESYTRQLRSMDDQVSYSTVEISLSEVAVLTPVDDSFATRISNAFTGGWRDFGSFCQGFAVTVVYLMPALLLIALILALIVVLTRKGRAARRAAKAAKREQAAAAQYSYPAQPGSSEQPAQPPQEEAPPPSGPKYKA